MSRLCRITILALFVASLLPAFAQNAAHLRKRVVADYTSGSKFLNPPYDVDQIPFHKLTHIIHAGVPWNSDGSLAVDPSFLEPKLISRAHKAGVRVMLLTGGDFNAIENSATIFNTVVSNVAAFVVANDYDGLDVDWEYPESAADRHILVKLMAALRDRLPAPRYSFSIDVAPWGGYGYDLKHLQTTVDFFNIMMYDCAGPWTSIGQLNSPIFWDHKNPAPEECQPGGSVEDTANIFLKHVPAEQLNMGTPFYGYKYTNVSALFGACPNDAKTPDGDCDNTVKTVNYGPDIKKLINKKGWVRYYDPVALVPYLLRKDGSPGYITYDDAFSTFARVYYADWVRGLGGTFMWSLDADYDGHSQDLLDAMYAASLGTPGK